MSASLQHSSFIIGMFHLLHLHDLLLLQHLDGVEPLIVFTLHQVDTTERSGTQSALDVEVGQCVLALGLSTSIGGLLRGIGIMLLVGVGIVVVEHAVDTRAVLLIRVGGRSGGDGVGATSN